VDAGAAAQTWTLSPADEATYIANINAIRAANGLNTLTLDANMTASARNWTTWMVENDTLAHADDIVSGAPADWLKVGENVGRGGSIASVWQAFLDSPGHAANVLDPSYDFVGVGVIWNADGRMYTTHRFASTESAESGGSADPQPTPEPQSTPVPDPAPEQPDAPPDPTPPEGDTAPDAASSDPVPEQLPFKDDPVLGPPAEPARIAVMMTLLLAAG